MKKYLVILIMAVAGLLSACQNDEPTATELLQAGKYEQAITKFEEYTEDKQNQQEAYRGIGIAYWELEDYQRSRAAFTKALSYGAEETGTICNFIGVCDMQLGYMESASEWFARGLEKENNSSELAKEMEFNHIVTLEELKDWDGAREKLEQYLAKYPEDEEAKKEAEFLKTR